MDIIKKNSVWIFILLITIFTRVEIVQAKDVLVVSCQPSEWVGQRVGFYYDGSEYNEENAMSMKATAFAFQEPILKSSRVLIRYGEDDYYDGEVRYFYSKSSSGMYVIVETQPRNLQEVYSIDLITGNTILTNTKMLFGFYKDVYTNTCDVITVDSRT